nr:MAG TPA: collagen alpha 1(VIII) chain protein [Caudoviricetes sp.]
MALVDVIIGYAKGAQGDVGPQGPIGPQGPEGPQGPMPTLINNALTTEAGMAALDAAMGKTLQDEITQTNSNLLWKRINASAVQGNATVTIPAGAKEVRVCITYADQFWSKDIPVSLLTGAPQIVDIGGNYYSSTDYSTISANAYTTGVQMRLVWINGVQQRDSAYMVVFYR